MSTRDIWEPTVVVAIAREFMAWENCQAAGDNPEWLRKHIDAILDLIDNYMPSGSGFDCGTFLDWERSTSEKLVFVTSYHHMDGESGVYREWTDHDIVVKPSLVFGFTMKVTGLNRNGIKDYIADTFNEALSATVHEEEKK